MLQAPPNNGAFANFVLIASVYLRFRKSGRDLQQKTAPGATKSRF